MVASVDQAEPITFHWHEVSRVEISTGQRRNLVKGVAGGALIGAGIVGLVGITSGTEACKGGQSILGTEQWSTVGCPNGRRKAISMAAMGGVGGAAVGLIMGMLIKSDTWLTTAKSIGIVPILGEQGRLGFAVRF